MEETLLEPPAVCFISYARSDDETFDQAVLSFKRDIEGLYVAHTGRRLHAYLDRVDLDWGEEWRKGISEAVLTATAFIPIITMQYFLRDACREELMAFYNDAKLQGVKELILPVVFAGSRRISSDDPREEVRIIADRQYKNFESAVVAGADSREWREAMMGVVESLIDALEKAEGRFSSVSPTRKGGASRRDAVSGADSSSDEEYVYGDEEAGFLELQDNFEEVMPEIESSLVDTMASFKKWEEVAQREFGKLQGVDQKEMRNVAFGIAVNLKGPSKEFGDSATQLSSHVARGDAIIRAMLDQMAGINLPEPQELVRNAMAGWSTKPQEMERIGDEMTDAIEKLKMISTLSVPIRRSLAPIQTGIGALRDAMEIFARWSRLSAR
jgi:hypothetical protein